MMFFLADTVSGYLYCVKKCNGRYRGKRATYKVETALVIDRTESSVRRLKRSRYKMSNVGPMILDV